eukprot:TRINITY_DN5346_c0_g1_i1.p1 TRINITY_DN5346_c0_g1~~TRINITY_DN5346_c0_g1_i1.p1  ORF type:complete len:529 (-),score=90.75 TRINITY_DN5346_c0_g1_i1:196-1782(-)
MAYTAHKDEKALKEHYDEHEVLEKNAKQVAKLIDKAEHIVVFTGAGASTLCGIPDFRGPTGVWTLAAKGEKRKGATINAAKAIPSYTHMALVELEKRNKLKYIISQNCDGLHRKSGIPSTKISELHGNRNLEKCVKCGKEYLRDFDATASYIFDVHDHRTGRKCNSCGGDLLDTIINFGENLREEDLDLAWKNTKQCDLFIVIGSSCTVTPACKMPELVGRSKKGKLVICNLQETPLDDLSDVRIFAKSDDFMRLVMTNLTFHKNSSNPVMTIPTFSLQRRVCVHTQPDNGKSRLWVYGVDNDGTMNTIFPGVVVNGSRLEAEPFVSDYVSGSLSDVELFFYGHYNEPPVRLQIPSSTSGEVRHYFDLTYHPLTGEWNIVYKGNEVEFLKSNYTLPSFPDTTTTTTNESSRMVGFSVDPKEDCPHFQRAVALGVAHKIAEKFKENKCKSCSDGSENWICLTCGETYCSRYVKGHCKEHFEETKHIVVLSFSDLSVWCYQCGDYIKDPFLTTMFVGELYKAKFGENPHH